MGLYIVVHRFKSLRLIKSVTYGLVDGRTHSNISNLTPKMVRTIADKPYICGQNADK